MRSPPEQDRPGIGITRDTAESLTPQRLDGDSRRVAPGGFSLNTPPLLVRAPGAARLCDVSERTWRKLDRTGRVPAALHVGRRRLWNVDELRRWTAAGCPVRERWEAHRGLE